MAGSGEREHHAAVSEAASPEPLVAPDRVGLPGARSEADIQRAGASGDPRVRAALASSLQASAGNQAVQRLVMQSRRLQRYKDTDRAGDWRKVTGANAIGQIADNGETLTFSSHEAYATAELIKKSGGMLAIKDSGVDLYPTETKKTVIAPDGTGKRPSAGSASTSRRLRTTRRSRATAARRRSTSPEKAPAEGPRS